MDISIVIVANPPNTPTFLLLVSALQDHSLLNFQSTEFDYRINCTFLLTSPCIVNNLDISTSWLIILSLYQPNTQLIQLVKKYLLKVNLLLSHIMHIDFVHSANLLSSQQAMPQQATFQMEHQNSYLSCTFYILLTITKVSNTLDIAK